MKKKVRKKYSIKKRKLPSKTGWEEFDKAIENFANNPPKNLEILLKKAENSIQKYIERGLI